MLDFQKEREAFELWAIKASGGWASFSKSHGDVYANNKLQFAWETWLAAKAQVPEGFVLVPKEPTLEMCHRGRNTRSFKVQDIYKAMIEAQEQGQ